MPDYINYTGIIIVSARKEIKVKCDLYKLIRCAIMYVKPPYKSIRLSISMLKTCEFIELLDNEKTYVFSSQVIEHQMRIAMYIYILYYIYRV